MQYHQKNSFDPLAFKWFSIVTFILMAWGVLAAWFAFTYKIPLDVFSLLSHEQTLAQCLVTGLIYGLVASFILVILGSLGYYNPIIAFVILLAGIIMFFDFVLGNSHITESKNLIWLMALPFVIIRDVVTYIILCKINRRLDQAKDGKFDGTQSQENYFS